MGAGGGGRQRLGKETCLSWKVKPNYARRRRAGGLAAGGSRGNLPAPLPVPPGMRAGPASPANAAGGSPGGLRGRGCGSRGCRRAGGVASSPPLHAGLLRGLETPPSLRAGGGSRPGENPGGWSWRPFQGDLQRLSI